MENKLKRTWADIDMDAIKYNFLRVKHTISPRTKILCVIKADAYGHGAVSLAQEYEQIGADWFAVSNFEEAFQLRSHNIKTPILILGYTPANMACELSQLNISQAVFSEKYAKELSYFATTHQVNVKIHLKIDTGMSRIGFVFNDNTKKTDIIETLAKVSTLPHLVPEGIFTHFSVSDELIAGKQTTLNQLNKFNDICSSLSQKGIDIKLRHCSNSAGILNYPQANLDMVRAGIILYGLSPSNELKNNFNLKPAMSLKTVVSQVKNVPKNTAIGYGGTFITKRNSKIATVPIGYADGYLRSLSGKACMLIQGKRVPVIGRICMDQTMLDVTDIDNVEENSVVTVFGPSNGTNISVDELATISNTINYEILCLVSKRVPRIYWKHEQQISQLNYLCPNEICC